MQPQQICSACRFSCLFAAEMRLTADISKLLNLSYQKVFFFFFLLFVCLSFTLRNGVGRLQKALGLEFGVAFGQQLSKHKFIIIHLLRSVLARAEIFGLMACWKCFDFGYDPDKQSNKQNFFETWAFLWILFIFGELLTFKLWVLPWYLHLMCTHLRLAAICFGWKGHFYAISDRSPFTAFIANK